MPLSAIICGFRSWSCYGCGEQLISEIQGYFTYMADKTMTLWENDTDAASCNHGFASYVLCWLETLNQTKKKGV